MTTNAKRPLVLLLLLALVLPILAACGASATVTPTAAPAAQPTAAPAAEPTAMAEPTAASAAEPTAMAEPTAGTAAQPTAASGAAMGDFKPRAVTAELTGSGASFPDPIYQKWIEEYKTVAPNVTINYQSVGSGQGRKDFFGDVTDFGGSDKFASDDELSKYGKDVLHIPTVLGAVVTTYNLEGVDKLQFSGETLAGIFLGTITSWSDPKIAADNPGVTLPDEPITVAHRSDGSGTTSIFTNYLSSVSADWKDKVGAGDSVEWPVGQGGEKNPGVAAIVQQTPGAIGYVELIYALANNLPVPAIKNAAGKFVEPTLESTSAAAEGFLANTPDDLRVNIVNPSEGESAYPIAGYTWVLLRKDWTDEAKAQAMTDFLYWALTKGGDYATELKYAPLPDSVREKALAKLTQVTVNGSPAFTMP